VTRQLVVFLGRLGSFWVSVSLPRSTIYPFPYRIPVSSLYGFPALGFPLRFSWWARKVERSSFSWLILADGYSVCNDNLVQRFWFGANAFPRYWTAFRNGILEQLSSVAWLDVTSHVCHTLRRADDTASEQERTTGRESNASTQTPCPRFPPGRWFANGSVATYLFSVQLVLIISPAYQCQCRWWGFAGVLSRLPPSIRDFHAVTKAPHFSTHSIRESNEHLRDTGGTAFAIRIPSSTPPDPPSHVKPRLVLDAKTPTTPRTHKVAEPERQDTQRHRETQHIHPGHTRQCKHTSQFSDTSSGFAPPLRLPNLEHGGRRIASAQWLIRASRKTAEP
jgi:hypothetical protein